jgi:NAD(P)-dependent dehydrogenase (short-subunit alcohol dehydrogenase family)
MDLNGKSAIVTGGSRGLGRALGEVLAAHGAKVLLVARNQQDLDFVVQGIRAAGGIAYGIAANVGDKDSVYSIVGQAAALIGPIDFLINNASILGPIPLRLLPDTECEDLEDVLQVNTLGPFRLMKAVLGSMVLRESGVVVNISSDAAIEAYPAWGAYGASKAALDHLTRIAAAELTATKVKLLSIDPGEMNTTMHADAMPDADPLALADPSAVASRIISLLQRLDEVESGSRIVINALEAQK